MLSINNLWTHRSEGEYGWGDIGLVGMFTSNCQAACREKHGQGPLTLERSAACYRDERISEKACYSREREDMEMAS